jgi:hypothetical protein
MKDLNFFSVLKKQKQKNKSIRIIAVSALLILLIVNLAGVGLGLLAFGRLNDQISNNRAFIDSADTKARVSEARVLNNQAKIAEDYLELLDTISEKINKTDRIKLELIDYVRTLTPQTTNFRRAEYDDTAIYLECYSTQIDDPMSIFHRLNQDERFSYVSMTEIGVNESGVVTFAIRLTQEGE